MPRRGILVLGMHRSGTSALAGMLVKLGAQAPATLMPPGPDNPLGYWESARLCAFHDHMLDAADSAWDDWLPFESASSTDLERTARLVAEADHLLALEFGEAPLFVLKDPRICRFVPFWLQRFQHAGVEPHAVIALRHPAAVAASLAARNGIGAEQAVLLWLRHLVDAEVATRGLRRAFVVYQDLLSDWRRAAERIAAALDLEWPSRAHGMADQDLDGFLRDDLCHFDFSDLDALAGLAPPTRELAGEAMAAFHLLGRVDASIEDGARERIDTVRRALTPNRLYLELAQRFSAQQRQLHEARAAAVGHAEVARRLEEASRELAESARDSESKTLDIQMMRSRIGDLEAFRNSVTRSRSWRWTAPFRAYGKARNR